MMMFTSVPKLSKPRAKENVWNVKRTTLNAATVPRPRRASSTTSTSTTSCVTKHETAMSFQWAWPTRYSSTPSTMRRRASMFRKNALSSPTRHRKTTSEGRRNRSGPSRPSTLK